MDKLKTGILGLLLMGLSISLTGCVSIEHMEVGTSGPQSLAEKKVIESLVIPETNAPALVEEEVIPVLEFVAPIVPEVAPVGQAAEPMSIESFSLADSVHFIGKYVEAEAVVSQVSELKNRTIFINLGGTYPNQRLSLAIFSRVRSEIKKLPSVGDRIHFSGVISEYKGTPQIVINYQVQMRIIE
jgi:hypothetical protein